MKIINHILCHAGNKPIDYRPTPNKGVKYTPLFLVMHYTAVTKARSSVDWFLNKAARASAHLSSTEMEASFNLHRLILLPGMPV